MCNSGGGWFIHAVIKLWSTGGRRCRGRDLLLIIWSLFCFGDKRKKQVRGRDQHFPPSLMAVGMHHKLLFRSLFQFQLDASPEMCFQGSETTALWGRQQLISWIAADLLPSFVLTVLDHTGSTSLSQLTSFWARTSIDGQKKVPLPACERVQLTSILVKQKNKTFLYHGHRLLIKAYYIQHIYFYKVFVSKSHTSDFQICFCLTSCVHEVHLWCLV